MACSVPGRTRRGCDSEPVADFRLRRRDELAAEGDHAAWEEIYRSVYPRLRAFAARRVDDTSIEFTDLADAPRVNGHSRALEVVGGTEVETSGTPDALPGYESMTIAQLRGKLRTLSVDEVGELLEWETAHGNRPPFVTMLSNRIATLNAQS